MSVEPFRGRVAEKVLEHEGVPILNQPFELVQWWPSVVIKCKCSSAGEAVVIVGHGSSICKGCKKVYQINELDYSRMKNHCRLDLGVMSAPQGNQS